MSRIPSPQAAAPLHGPVAARNARHADPIVLYGFGPWLGLPDGSPYVLKTEIQLKMAGLAYVKDLTGFARAPKARLPYLRDGLEIVPDSSFIRWHIERKYGLDLDAGLGPRQRAEAWSIERLLEDHLGWAATWFRWIPAENFAAGPARFFDGAPPELRDDLRNAALARLATGMQAQGIGRHSMNEIAQLGIRSLDSFAMLLGGRDFLFGDTPTATDATAAGLLAALVVPDLDSPLRRRALQLDNVTDYVTRMMARYFPPVGRPVARMEEKEAEVAA